MAKPIVFYISALLLLSIVTRSESLLWWRLLGFKDSVFGRSDNGSKKVPTEDPLDTEEPSVAVEMCCNKLFSTEVKYPNGQPTKEDCLDKLKEGLASLNMELNNPRFKKVCERAVGITHAADDILQLLDGNLSDGTISILLQAMELNIDHTPSWYRRSVSKIFSVAERDWWEKWYKEGTMRCNLAYEVITLPELIGQFAKYQKAYETYNGNKADQKDSQNFPKADQAQFYTYMIPIWLAKDRQYVSDIPEKDILDFINFNFTEKCRKLESLVMTLVYGFVNARIPISMINEILVEVDNMILTTLDSMNQELQLVDPISVKEYGDTFGQSGITTVLFEIDKICYSEDNAHYYVPKCAKSIFIVSYIAQYQLKIGFYTVMERFASVHVNMVPTLTDIITKMANLMKSKEVKCKMNHTRMENFFNVIFLLALEVETDNVADKYSMLEKMLLDPKKNVCEKTFQLFQGVMKVFFENMRDLPQVDEEGTDEKTQKLREDVRKEVEKITRTQWAALIDGLKKNSSGEKETV